MSVITRRDENGKSWELIVTASAGPGSETISFVPASGPDDAADASASVSAGDIIWDAMAEINAVAPGEPVSAADASFALRKLNRLINNWNAEPLFIYDVQVYRFTLTPGHQPHTIGVVENTPDFAVNGFRPLDIAYANIILNGGLRTPLKLVDHGEWAALALPELKTPIPQWLRYDKDWPNGNLYLWPVPTTAYDVEIYVASVLHQVADLATLISLPPGYRDAVTLTLAESLCEAFGKTPGAILLRDANEARARIRSVNVDEGTMKCDDALTTEGGLGGGMATFLSGGLR